MWGNSYMSNPQQAHKVVFEGDCQMKHDHQIFRASKYCVLMSNGDFKIFEKESDYKGDREPHRILKVGDDIEGDVKCSGKELTMSVPNLQKTYNIKLGNDSDATYWCECLTSTIQNKRMEKMQGVTSQQASYSTMSPIGIGGVGGGGVGGIGIGIGVSPASLAAPAISNPTTVHIQKNVHAIINGYQDALRTNAQLSQDQARRMQWPVIGKLIEDGIAKLVDARGNDGTIAEDTIVQVKAALKSQLTTIGYSNPSFVVDGNNIITFDNTLRFMKSTASSAPVASGTATGTGTSGHGPSAPGAYGAGAGGYSSASYAGVGMGAVGVGLAVGGGLATYNAMADPSASFSKNTTYMVDTKPTATNISAPSSGSMSGVQGKVNGAVGVVGGYATQAVHQVGGAMNTAGGYASNIGGQMYSGASSGINQAGSAIGNVNIGGAMNTAGGYASNIGGQMYSGASTGINQAGSAIGNVNMPNIGGGGVPQMYVPTFNTGNYSNYASSASSAVGGVYNQAGSAIGNVNIGGAMNTAGGYASNFGGQMYSGASSGFHQVTSAVGNMHIDSSITHGLAVAGGAVIGALTSDGMMKMLSGLGQLASNIPLLGVIGVSMKLFFDAAALAKYNKKAAEALSARIREVGDILNELCATVTSPSATMNTQLQNLDSLINEIAKFIEKFQSKGYISRLLSGSSDDASIKNFDKQLLDLIQLVQLTIGTKTIQLQQRTLQGMDEMNSLIRNTMNSKRAPGDSDDTVMGKLSQEDIDKIAKAAGLPMEDLKSEINAKLDEIAASQKRTESNIDKLVAMNGGGDSLSMANEKAKRFWDEYFQAKVISYENFLEGFEEEFNKGTKMSQRCRDKIIRCIDIPNSSGHGDGNISYIEWKRFFRSIFADSKTDFSPTFDVISYVEHNLK